MQLRRLFVGGYQELRRPVHTVDQSLMERIERAREDLRLQGKDVVAVLGAPPASAKPMPDYVQRRANRPQQAADSAR